MHYNYRICYIVQFWHTHECNAKYFLAIRNIFHLPYSIFSPGPKINCNPVQVKKKVTSAVQFMTILISLTDTPNLHKLSHHLTDKYMADIILLMASGGMERSVLQYGLTLCPLCSLPQSSLWKCVYPVKNQKAERKVILGRGMERAPLIRLPDRLTLFAHSQVPLIPSNFRSR